MEEFAQSLRAMDKDDRRGMRLDAILRSAEREELPQPRGDPLRSARPAPLEDVEYQALVERLSFEADNVYMDEQRYFAERPPGKLPLPRSATQCSSVTISGVRYTPSSRSQGDSNVMFRHPTSGTEPIPGRIESIILNTRRGTGGEDDIEETFLIARRLKALNGFDVNLDPYRKYPNVGGRLYYNAYDDAMLALRCQDISSHFALTSMDHLVVRAPGSRNPASSHPCLISRRCVHVRPLDRVRKLLSPKPFVYADYVLRITVAPRARRRYYASFGYHRVGLLICCESSCTI